MPGTNHVTTVYEKLKERIEAGYYSPSESLPEVKLATEYGVSRNTIKKALLMLESDAFVTIEQNKGAKVRNYSKQEVLDYLDLRVELEGFITRLAVPCFAEKDIRRLESIFESMTKCREAGDLLAYSAQNLQFHNAIYDACPNKTAAEMLVRLKTQMRKYNAKTILVPKRDAQSCEEHRAILDAIRARDAKTAEQCIRRHIENVRRTYDEYFSLFF